MACMHRFLFPQNIEHCPGLMDDMWAIPARLPPLPPTSLDAKNGILAAGLIAFHCSSLNFIGGMEEWKLDV
jgi:hypothetical protein